jgi:hypothetical protein
MFEEKAVHPIDVLKAMFPDVSAVEIKAVLSIHVWAPTLYHKTIITFFIASTIIIKYELMKMVGGLA